MNTIQDAIYELSQQDFTSFEIPDGQWSPWDNFHPAAAEAITAALDTYAVNGWQTCTRRGWRASIRGNKCTVRAVVA